MATADRDRINAALERVWDNLLVLADMEEESGDPDTAAGYRWLAGHRKWPCRRDRHGHGYFWYWFGRQEGTMSESDELPLVRAVERKYHLSLAAAMREAAEVVGRWLKEGRG